MLTLDQLTTPITEDEALETSLTILSQLGFQATSWQSGGIQRTLLSLFCKTWAQLSTIINAIANGGFASTSSGAWLTLVAKYVFNIARLDAQATIGQILLTNSGGGTNTFAAGDIIVADQPNGTASANTYTCTAGGTLGPHTTLSVEFKANVAGAAGNIAPGTTLYLWTPISNVTATNPALVPTSNTWVTTPGADAESDQRLALRCLSAWPQRTYSNTNGAYIGWALTALPALTRAQMVTAPGNGTVQLVGATALGAIDSGQITTIEDYINGVSDGIGRRPLNDIFTAVGATTVTSPALTVTAYCIASAINTAPALITAALLNYIGNIPLGGTLLTGSQGRVLFTELLAAINPVPFVPLSGIAGVRSASLNITSDVLLSPGQIYLPAITVNTLLVAPGS